MPVALQAVATPLLKVIKRYKHRELGLTVPSKAVLLITNPSAHTRREGGAECDS